MSSRILEKVERRLGEKLMLKGDRCAGPKCALTRRAYPPGMHGKKKVRRRAGSEYSLLLREKQKVRFAYGLDDKAVERYSKEAVSTRGIFAINFLRKLEMRLDNAVFRLGLTSSRRVARQAVSHGHITVNGKTVTISSYQVRKGDMVATKDRPSSHAFFGDLDMRLKKYETPKWLELDKAKKTGSVKNQPEMEDMAVLVDVTKIKEFYSR